MRKTLFTAVFISGLTSLGLEMAASRLLGNVFGTSNIVWASIIGLILLYLSAGYFVGGRLADRYPYHSVFYRILIWAAFSAGLVPAISRPVLRLAANAFDELQMGVLMGSFTGVLILLAIPMTLLGMASPFAIRLAVQDTREAGSSSGKIYAISTLGSFFGTFLPVLVLIPLVGTYCTFLVLSGLLMTAAFIGLWLCGEKRKFFMLLWMPAVLLALSFISLRGTDKNSAYQIFETESAYNYIQVLERDGVRYLRLNEGQGVHSIYYSEPMNFFGPWEQVLAAPFFNPGPVAISDIQRMAIVGLAAGTTARQAALIYPDMQIDGYEIDPEIVTVGREYFGMNNPNLNIFVQDGRWGLEHSRNQYDIISVDAYRPPYIPYHMTTREFFQSAYDHLTEDGVLVINIGRGPTDRRIINALSSTLLAVFPTVHVMDIPNAFNSIVFATVQPTSHQYLFDNIAALQRSSDTPQLLLDTLYITAQNLQPSPEPAQVFTDDWAPIEWLTNDLVLDFVFSDNMENLQ